MPQIISLWALPSVHKGGDGARPAAMIKLWALPCVNKGGDGARPATMIELWALPSINKRGYGARPAAMIKLWALPSVNKGADGARPAAMIELWALPSVNELLMVQDLPLLMNNKPNPKLPKQKNTLHYTLLLAPKATGCNTGTPTLPQVRSVRNPTQTETDTGNRGVLALGLAIND